VAKLIHNPKLLRYGSHGAAAIATVAVLGLAAIALYQPLRMKQRMIEEEIYAAQDLLSRGSNLRERHRLAVAEDIALQKELLELKNCLPHNADEAQFIHTLSELALERQVTLTKFSPGATQKLTEFRTLEIQVSGTGGYASVCSFLHALPELKRIFTVERLQLSSASAQGDQCSFEIAIRLLYTSEPTLVAHAE
jgi:Tfp pilus assembly protein PilO